MKIVTTSSAVTPKSHHLQPAGNAAAADSVIERWLKRARGCIAVCVLALLFAFLGACNTTGQPDYAQAYQSEIQQVTVVPRTITFSPTSRADSKLEVEMLSVTEDGALLLRSLFGINELKKGRRKLLNGQYVLLLESDHSSQVARLKTWPKAVFR